MSTDDQQQNREEVGQWGLVVLFWAFVGIPLAWGIIQTLIKAARLFQ